MAFFSRVVAMVPFLIECEYWALTSVEKKNKTKTSSHRARSPFSTLLTLDGLL
jgi:hypothetical protein